MTVRQDDLTEEILNDQDGGSILKVTIPDHGDDTVIDGTSMAGPDRSGGGLKVLLFNILCNLVLFAGKLIAGITMRSAAVTADAFNNLTDTVSNIIGIVGIRLAGEPADRTHPFGHGRIEYLTSFIVSGLIIALGGFSLYESILKLIKGERAAFEWLAFLFLFVSVGVKVFMGILNKKIGRRIDSTILMTAGADALSDVIVTASMIGVILLERILPVPLDGAAGVIVSALVMWTGVRMAKQSADFLIGRSADPELVGDVIDCIKAHDGVQEVHELLLHNYGPEHIDGSAHVEVSKELTLEEAHAIADRIEADVHDRWGIHMVIHIDPV